MKKIANTLCFNAKGQQVDNPYSRETVKAMAEQLPLSMWMMESNGPEGKIKNAELSYALDKFKTANTNSTKQYWMKSAAEQIGNTNQMELEQAIFTLSSHFIKDKAPELFDNNYFIGFQVLDKSDDNTKVVGIYGFKVGKTWLYIPIFFDKGKLSGYELLYIQNKDLFVPLKSGWINWIIKNSGDSSFGIHDRKDMRSLGIRYPDMTQLTQPPVLGKVAAAFDTWAQNGIISLAKNAGAKISLPKVDLFKFASTDKRIFEQLASACDAYPMLKAAVDSFYGKEFFHNAYTKLATTQLKLAKAKGTFTKAQPRTKTAAVRVITQEDTGAFPWLTEKQAMELIDRPITIDYREDDEVASIEDTMDFDSPSETGVYDVFLADGSIRECLVIVAPLFVKKKPDREICLVVDWKRRRHVFAKTMAVLCVRGSSKKDWFNRLPADAFKSATSMRNAEAKGCSRRVIISPCGKGTAPVSMENHHDGVWVVNSYLFGTNQRDRTYDIKNEGADHSMSFYQSLEKVHNSYESQQNKIEGCVPNYVIASNTFAGKKLVCRDDKLYLPEKFKFIDLDPMEEVKDENGNYSMCFANSMALATENDIISLIQNNQKKLNIVKSASKYILDHKEFNKEAAFKSLVLDYGFRDKLAWDILNAADIAEGSRLNIPYIAPSVKVAELPIDLMGMGSQGGNLWEMGDNTMSPSFEAPPIGADSFSGLPVEMPYDQVQQLGFEDLPTPTDWLNEVPAPDPMAMQAASEAAATGDKDLFDTATLVGLLKTNRSEEVLSDYLKTLKNALDKIGRILFKLFWDRETFRDKFGDGDLLKLEDTLLDTWSNLGDLVLFMSERSNEPDVDDILADIQED